MTATPAHERRASGTEDLIPAGATNAKLCVYEGGAAGGSLLGARPLAGEPGDLTEALNTLPKAGNDPFCPSLESETYKIVVSYENRHLIVDMTPYCVAARDGEIRDLGLRELVAVVKGFGDFQAQGSVDFDPQSSTNVSAELHVRMRHQEELRPALAVIREAAFHEASEVCLGFEDVDVGTGILVGLPREPSPSLNAAISQARELAKGFGGVTVAVSSDACGSSAGPPPR